MIVRAGTTFEVGDHDFTKFSIVPSVVLIVGIPNVIQQSWYRGQVMVGFKDAAFEASSLIRHSTELSHVLSRSDGLHKPVLFVYSDGGPDHRLTYMLLFKCLSLHLQKARPRLPMCSKDSPPTFLEESCGACNVHTQSRFAMCWTNAEERR